MYKKSLINISIVSVLSLGSVTVYAGSVEEIPDIAVKKGKGFHGMVGAGAISAPEYVGGDENDTVAIPIINVSYNDSLYFKFNRAGWWAWKPNKNVRLGLELGYRFGWEREDLESSLDFDLTGPQYKEVDPAILVGANIAYKVGGFSAEVSVLGSSADENYYGEEPGTEIVVRGSYTMAASRNLSFTASVKVEALSEDTVNYFYGIDGYEGDSTTNVTLAAIGTYKFSKNWTVLGGVSANLLGDEIKDSPIVADETQTIALVGVGYSF